jgi:hypothetical protein
MIEGNLKNRAAKSLAETISGVATESSALAVYFLAL